MVGRDYKHSGLARGKFNNIEPYSTLIVSGIGGAEVNNIGHNCIITKSGVGTLVIEGTVGENVTFIVSGVGDVIFKKQPPESTLNRFEKSGVGRIITPNMGNSKSYKKHSVNNPVVIGDIINNVVIGSINTSKPVIGNINTSGEISSLVQNDGLIKVTRNGRTTTYAGSRVNVIADEVYIDGEKVKDSDPRILHVENAATNNTIIMNDFGNFSSQAFIQSALAFQSETNSNQKNSDEKSQINVDEYSPVMETYIKSFEKKIKNTEQLKNLQLSAEDELWLKNYYDPVTFEIMNIPVTLNERLYDLDTLLKIQAKDKKDPFNRQPFALRDIQTARKDAEALQSIITKIEEAHSETKIIEQSFHPKKF